MSLGPKRDIMRTNKEVLVTMLIVMFALIVCFTYLIQNNNELKELNKDVAQGKNETLKNRDIGDDRWLTHNETNHIVKEILAEIRNHSTNNL